MCGGRQGAEARRDDLLSDVLVLPAGTDMHNHPLVLSHKLILQVPWYPRVVPWFSTDILQCCALPLLLAVYSNMYT